MVNKFKIGDYVKVCSDDSHPDLKKFKEQILKVAKLNPETATEEEGICLKTLGDVFIEGENQYYREGRFELLTGDVNKLPSPQLFMCVKKSCNNICGNFYTTILEAKQKVSDSSEHIIYELVPKVKITTQKIEENL